MFDQDKQRIIQEFVPGKQVTLAHVIANPVSDLYRKIGAMDDQQGALGILTITPSEAAIIAADVSTKSGEVELVFVDRFSGSVIIENTFNLNGMGKLYIGALNNHDYELALAIQMFYTVVSLVGALVIDLSYGLVDPRVRIDK